MTEKVHAIGLSEERNFVNNANVDGVYEGTVSDKDGNQFTIKLSKDEMELLQKFYKGEDIDFMQLAPVSDKVGSLKIMKRLQEALQNISSPEEMRQYQLSGDMNQETLAMEGFAFLNPNVYNARIMIKKLALKHYGEFPKFSGIPKVELLKKEGT